MNLYSHTDYKKYLADTLKKTGSRGAKAEIADAAGCQRSFLSQVLHGNVHLTLEHALGIAQHLRLNKSETEYFYCLIALARSGSMTLNRFYLDKLNSIRAEGDSLSKRLESAKKQIDDHVINEYYSSWKFSAVHIGCTIPSWNTPQIISKKLKLLSTEIEQILLKLETWGLVEQKKGEWKATQRLIHLPKDHFMTFTNHRNWRSKNLDIAEQSPKGNVNYTGTYSMSKEDLARLKEMTIEFLNETRALVQSSPEEELVSFCLDITQL